ncbi:MAG: amidohydrolase family protein [Myxococcota bacterium]
MILSGATLLDLDPVSVRRADVRIEGGTIVDVGDLDGEGVDLRGSWLMPGLVVAHHHLYAALACGMPTAPEAPETFTQMLRRVWWRLDEALDLDAIEASALVGGVAALRAGVTTIVDHHASPNAIAGSLEAIDGALGALGLRRVLAYEVTDRGGAERARAGLRAHEGLLASRTPKRGVLVGMHASLTLSDDTIRDCAALARSAGVGVHVHVAEAVDDVREGSPVARLERLGALLPGSVLAHGVHLGGDDLARIADAGAWLTHQPRSNMNNTVGRARVAAFPARVAIGTDGIGADVIAELQAGYFRAREDHAGWGPARWAEALAAGARLAGESLGVRLGRIAPGHAADLVVLDPAPGPPLVDLPAALVFRFGAGMVRDVMVAGAWRLRDRRPVGVDAGELDARAQSAARVLWERM